jgi:hypothetical protein
MFRNMHACDALLSRDRDLVAAQRGGRSELRQWSIFVLVSFSQRRQATRLQYYIDTNSATRSRIDPPGMVVCCLFFRKQSMQLASSKQ